MWTEFLVGPGTADDTIAEYLWSQRKQEKRLNARLQR